MHVDTRSLCLFTSRFVRRRRRRLFLPLFRVLRWQVCNVSYLPINLQTRRTLAHLARRRRCCSCGPASYFRFTLPSAYGDPHFRSTVILGLYNLVPLCAATGSCLHLPSGPLGSLKDCRRSGRAGKNRFFSPSVSPHARPHTHTRIYVDTRATNAPTPTQSVNLPFFFFPLWTGAHC